MGGDIIAGTIGITVCDVVVVEPPIVAGFGMSCLKWDDAIGGGVEEGGGDGPDFMSTGIR